MGRQQRGQGKRRSAQGRGSHAQGRQSHDGAFARDFKRMRPNEWKQNRAEDGRHGAMAFHEMKKENDMFDKYYKAQKIVPEDEWETLISTLRSPLPMTFRINGSGKFATQMRDQLEGTLFAQLMRETVNTEDDEELRGISPPTPLAWYPERLAWQFNYSRAQLRRLPVLQGIFDFIKNANELGSISRQEAVSMIPPFFLDAQPHHRILDMCASPGSKTFQILERMHGEMLEGASKMPTGFVIANDVDLKRCNLLTHQTKRANSPTLLVTNHEAQNFPIILGPKGEKFEFDAILCDVPCTGDATMRKAPDIWDRWTPGNANGLHPLQLKIAFRGAQLLKVGGRLVYSTCSLNPIENEAVVAALLKETNGALELLDVSAELPNLKRSPGLHEWQVWDKYGHHPTFESNDLKHKLSETMFSNEETKRLPLERCLRLLPHHQDTGGFFVAVFQKIKDLEVEEDPARGQSKERLKVELTVNAQENVQLSYSTYQIHKKSYQPTELAVDEKGEYLLPHRGPNTPKGGNKWIGIDPVLPVNDEKVINSILEVYGMDRELIPLHKNCVTRTTDTTRPKRIYTITDGMRQYLACDDREQLRVTACGLKSFERQEIKEVVKGQEGVQLCDFRLTQDGMPMLFPFVTNRIVRTTIADYKTLLERRTLAFEHIAEAPERAVVSCAVTKAALIEIPLGCCVLVPRDEDLASIGASQADLAIACWRGRTSCNLLVSKVETIHFVDKLKMSLTPSQVDMET